MKNVFLTEQNEQLTGFQTTLNNCVSRLHTNRLTYTFIKFRFIYLYYVKIKHYFILIFVHLSNYHF